VQRQSTFVMAQMASEGSPEVNLEKAKKAIEKAVSLYHPDVVIFPELYMSLFPSGTAHEIALATAQPLDGPFVIQMREQARQHGIWLIFGMNEAVEASDDHRNYNTTLVINSEGEIVSTYRKTHLYDAFGYKESDTIKAGDRFFEPIETPFGKIGLFVCYEVRFPEVARYQRSKGADIIVMPTAWMAGKLKSHHFRTLITARAIENTVYMLACDQCNADTIGESVAVDPMGVPIASGGESEELLVARIDLDRVETVRAKLPAYKDRRPELYTI
jgi:predicted amidohydrolase